MARAMRIARAGEGARCTKGPGVLTGPFARSPIGGSGSGRRSEGDDALEDEPVELPAVAEIGRREVVVLLLHVLALEQDARGDEPAGGERGAIGADLLRHVLELARHGVPARAD